jgi:peptidoglycan/xylan/chitin deacetylase (PgdA/CDA1 family)
MCLNTGNLQPKMLGLLLIAACICVLNLPETCTKGGLVAITLDDGPVPYTHEIMDIAKKNNVKLTFHFTITEVRQGNIKSIYKRAVDEGHEVGLRLSPKREYSGMSTEDMENEIGSQIGVLEKLTGKKVKWARVSRADEQDGEGDKSDEDIYKALWKRKVYETTYAFCPDDLSNPLEDFDDMISSTNPKYASFIVLLHDQMEAGRPLLEDIIDLAQRRGYKIVPLSECLSGYNPDEKGEDKGGSSSGVESLCLYLPFLALIYQFLL